MSKLALLNTLKEQAKETAVNMTEAQKGGQKARLLPEGYSLARIVGYVEYGNQPQSFEGKPKPPAPEFHLAFALYDEGYANEDGTPYVVETFRIAEQRWEKSKAFKMFKLLNWQNLHTTWIDLLGEPIMVKIEHYKGGKDKKETKSRIVLDGFLPPTDPRSKKPYDTPELDENLLSIFLWDYPNLECWDALRDFHKDAILKATNFAGSELEGLLIENGRPLSPSKKEDKDADEDEGKEEETPSTPEPDTGDLAMPTPEA